MTHSLWLSPSGLATSGKVLTLCALLTFHQHKAQGWVIQCLKVPQLPPPPVSLYGPAISVNLTTAPSVSERASGVIWKMGILDVPLDVLFRHREGAGATYLGYFQ